MYINFFIYEMSLIISSVLINQLSKKEKKKPWFLAFADFCGINTPTEVSFKQSMV